MKWNYIVSNAQYKNHLHNCSSLIGWNWIWCTVTSGRIESMLYLYSSEYLNNVIGIVIFLMFLLTVFVRSQYFRKVWNYFETSNM